MVLVRVYVIDRSVVMLVIITFGDNTYGQLGTMKLPAGVHSRYGQNTSHVMTVDVLRGKDCIQVQERVSNSSQ